MIPQDVGLGDVAGVAVAALAEDGVVTLRAGLGDQAGEGAAHGAVRVDGEHGAIHVTQGRDEGEAGLLIEERSALLEPGLRVAVHDDPEGVAAGPRESEELEMPAVERIEIARCDGDLQGFVSRRGRPAQAAARAGECDGTRGSGRTVTGQAGGKRESGLRRRQEERRELEGAAVPAVEPTEAFEDLGRGALGGGGVLDAAERGGRLLQGGQDLAAQEIDE